MKGMVFTEFLEMVEQVWSHDMVDDIIAHAKVASGGAYTAVGTYPHEEMLALVGALSERTGTPVDALVRAFGKHLFGRFALAYPRFFTGVSTSFDFLSGIEQVIHAEVRKLYPDAMLPTFEVSRQDDRLEMIYISRHPFADLAHGLMEGCVAYFGEAITITRASIADHPRASARFILTRAS